MMQAAQSSLDYCQEVIARQMDIINFQQEKLQWYEGVLSNKKLPINMRLALIAAKKLEESRPPGKDGFIPSYLPAMADTVGVSASTISRGLRAASDSTQAIEIRVQPDKHDPYKSTVLIRPTEKLARPQDIEPIKEIKRHGGARIARCKCGSEQIVETKKWICADCGEIYKEFERRPVNSAEQQDEESPLHLAMGAEEPTEAVMSDPESLQDAMGGKSSQEDEESPLQDAMLTVYTLGLDCTDEEIEEPVARCNGIPAAEEELRSLPQWVCWRAEEKPGSAKPTKVPYNPNGIGKANVSDPSTWGSYEQAQAAYERSQAWARPYSGIGFVFNHNGIVGIDQDGDLVPRIDSYSELSVSETGVHIFARGTIPTGRRRNGIEMYDSGRFFAWTGKHLTGTPLAIEDRQVEIDALYEELAPPIPLSMPAAVQKPLPSAARCSRTDEEILEKARNASNGAKFRALYDEGTITGYRSQSEADLALCEMLRFWAENNVSTIDRLFRRSRLMREKWDSPARSGETYGEGTIRILLEGRQEQEQSA